MIAAANDKTNTNNEEEVYGHRGRQTGFGFGLDLDEREGQSAGPSVSRPKAGRRRAAKAVHLQRQASISTAVSGHPVRSNITGLLLPGFLRTSTDSDQQLRTRGKQSIRGVDFPLIIHRNQRSLYQQERQI